MLTPPLRLEIPWHSKQYFWKVSGGWNVCGVGGGALAGRGAGPWAPIIAAPANTRTPQNPKRVIGLPQQVASSVSVLPEGLSVERLSRHGSGQEGVRPVRSVQCGTPVECVHKARSLT